MTFTSFGDNALMNVQNNGVNSVSIDLPNYTPGNLEINHNPRNGLPYFNTALFTPNALGTQGDAKRRFFYGPGIDNSGARCTAWSDCRWHLDCIGIATNKPSCPPLVPH